MKNIATTRVVMLPEVVDYFLELASIFYDKGYFGFEDSAIRYAKELFTDIRDNLPGKYKKAAPTYFVRYINNNHVIAQYL